MAEPFGTTAPENNPAGLGAFTFNLRMPGQYADSETGLFYNYFRDYDAGIGRYVQSDPIGLAAGVNTYTYVGGKPVSYADPDGLVRQGGQTGQWWEFRDRNFQRWFHLCVKQRGDPDATRGELADAHALWVSLGKPDGKNGCGGPPPPPPAPSGDTCGEDCKKVATTVVIGGTAYIVYRCLRMVPSLFPPLWPTIPANVAIP
jgi:RHS repeat-associated protein